MHTLAGHTDTVTSAAFSPDGTLVVTASNDSTAKVWDVATGNEVHTLAGHTDTVTSAAFSPDGKLVVTASDDSTAKVWDVATGNEVHTLVGHTGAVYSVAFSPDGALVVTASDDSTAKVWDVATGDEAAHPGRPHGYGLLGGLQPGRRAGGDGQLGQHALRCGTWRRVKKLHTLAGHTGSIFSAAFSPDGALVVTASWDNTRQGVGCGDG